MAKKKKKVKEKPKSVKEKSKVLLDNIDNVLKSSKKTESALHSMLKGVTEEKVFIAPKEEDTKIAPQLSYETKKQIAEDYVLEDVSLTKRDSIEKRKPISTTLEKNKTTIKSPSTTQSPSFSKKDDIYVKLAGFFEGVFDSYVERYNQWENSISSILSILRKMRKITKKNTEELVSSIGGTYDRIQYNLEQFKLKRDVVEKIADIDVESMSSEFKKVLGLLELQVKEYQLKKLSDEYFHQQKTFY